MVTTRHAARVEEDELARAIAASLKIAPRAKRAPRKRKAKNSTTQKKPNAPEKKGKVKLTKTAGVAKAKKTVVISTPAVPVRKRKLLLKLTVNYSRIEYNVIRRFKIVPVKQAKEYWPWPKYPRLKLGHNSWTQYNWKGPTAEEVRQVHKALTDYHATFKFEQYVNMPAYATKTVCTVDVIIQTMFAQSTDNAIAIDVHSRLCNAFPYVVNGRKCVGKIPNWHEVRHLPAEELEVALQSGGMKEVRAKRILKFLNDVHAANDAREQQGLQSFEHDGNAIGAVDFVPGMLSLDYMMVDAEDTSDEALIGRLTSIDGMGMKSAMCILAFALKRPLFVVDTHVLRLTKLLG